MNIEIAIKAYNGYKTVEPILTNDIKELTISVNDGSTFKMEIVWNEKEIVPQTTVIRYYDSAHNQSIYLDELLNAVEEIKKL